MLCPRSLEASPELQPELPEQTPLKVLAPPPKCVYDPALGIQHSRHLHQNTRPPTA